MDKMELNMKLNANKRN